MAKLFTVEAGKLNTFNGRLHEVGMTAEEVDVVQADKTGALASVMLLALRGHLKTTSEADAERRRVAEEANRIVIMDSGYNGGPAEEQRCKGPYLTYPIGWTPKSALERRDILMSLFPPALTSVASRSSHRATTWMHP